MIDPTKTLALTDDQLSDLLDLVTDHASEVRSGSVTVPDGMTRDERVTELNALAHLIAVRMALPR